MDLTLTAASLWSELGTVPWQHWAALAAAGWVFALVSFLAASTPHRQSPRPRGAVEELIVLDGGRDRSWDYSRKAA